MKPADVNATTTESSPAMGPGSDIRALRQSRGMTLSALALALGRSVGWVSQVERGLSEPTISDLRRIATFFGVPLSLFFRPGDAPESERGHIVRANGRRQLGTAESGLTEELLSPDLGGAFEVVRSVFAPGAALPEPVTRPTEEAGYVVSGVLELTIDGRVHLLQPGDAFRFKHQAFQWRNPGSEPTVVIWVIAPPIY